MASIRETKKAMLLKYGKNSKITGDYARSLAVRCENGTFVGRRDGSVVSYLGIPYAKPPVGERRWKRPEPVDKVEPGAAGVTNEPGAAPEPIEPIGATVAADMTSEFGVTSAPGEGDIYEAYYFGPSPIQTEIASERGSLYVQSEDCLYLNVWVNTDAQAPAPLKPVLVFIHGGSYGWGGTSDPLYDGKNLITKFGDIILVTVEYRTGIMGFIDLSFVGGDEKYKDGGAEFPDSGNLGLLDQIEALRWIKRNIKNFGGDPENITVAGESAGAGSASLLPLIDEAKGLFQKIIAESGSIALTYSREEVHDFTVKLMEGAAKKLETSNKMPEGAAKKIEASNKMSEGAAKKIEASNKMSEGAGKKFGAKDKATTAAAGTEAKIEEATNAAAGTKAKIDEATDAAAGTKVKIDEATDAAAAAVTMSDLMALSEDDLMELNKPLNEVNNFPLRDGRILPEDLYKAYEEGKASHVTMLSGTNADEARYWINEVGGVIAYSASIPILFENNLKRVSLDDKKLIDKFLEEHKKIDNWGRTEFYTEIMFRIPAILQAEYHAKNGGTNYLYYWDYPSALNNMGACHAVELAYVFNNLTETIYTGDNIDFELADRVQQMWVSFVRCGNPTATAPAWPPYNPTTRPTMIIGSNTHVELDPLSNQRKLLTPIIKYHFNGCYANLDLNVPFFKKLVGQLIGAALIVAAIVIAIILGL